MVVIKAGLDGQYDAGVLVDIVGGNGKGVGRRQKEKSKGERAQLNLSYRFPVQKHGLVRQAYDQKEPG